MDWLVGGWIGFTLGAAALWWIGRIGQSKLNQEIEAARLKTEAAQQENQQNTVKLAGAEASLAALEKRLEQITADRESLKESFGALAASQLKSNRDEFLKQAEERFGKSEQKHKGELEKRHEAIEKEFKSVNESLEKFRKLHDEYDSQRVKDFSALRQQMLQLSEKTDKLGESTTGLSTALRGSSQSRGKWGEVALRNIVEAAGMTEHCDFVEQSADDSGRRPDLVVHLPGEARIPIDAKVPYADYDRLMSSTDPDSQATHMRKHGETVRTTMRELAKRNYAEQLEGDVDFTVMFIPIESVASAAFASIPTLQEEAIEKKILITTPVTLIALLRTVAIYWRQEQMAQNAKEVWSHAQELHKRLMTFHGHMGRVKTGLEGAVNHFNKAIASYETRVLPQGRKIDELSSQESEQRAEEPSLFIENQVSEVRSQTRLEDGGD